MASMLKRNAISLFHPEVGEEAWQEWAKLHSVTFVWSQAWCQQWVRWAVDEVGHAHRPPLYKTALKSARGAGSSLSQWKACFLIKNVCFYFMPKQESIISRMIIETKLNVFLISRDKKVSQLGEETFSAGCWFNVALLGKWFILKHSDVWKSSAFLTGWDYAVIHLCALKEENLDLTCQYYR